MARRWLKDTGRRLIFHGPGEKYLAYPVEAKTASYTVLPEDAGKTFTNRGDTDAITFTLPATTAVESGWWAQFYVVEAFDLAVVAGTVDTMVVIGDKTADSVKWSTSGEIIGGGCKVIHDGTGWLVIPFTWDNGTIVTTVTTAT